MKPFPPKEMQSRWEKLKTEGNIPSLADVIKAVQMDDIHNTPSAGESGEPSYTTPAGFPICSVCGPSTRNRNRLICRPCESGTRLLLTDEDRRWLREMGIARSGDHSNN